jgi:malonyl-CoA/methylmalonyl-CoA synthetase
MANFYAQLDTVFTANQASDCFRLLDREDWSYGDLQGHVGRIAGVLKSQGVSVGDRVAVQVEKSPENLALYLATLRIGAIYLPLNTGYTSAELDYFIGDAEPALFVGARPREDVTSLTLNADGSGTLIELSSDARTPPIEELAGSDLAAILYTSGTTGRSKGAMLSHDNLASNAAALSEAWDWQDDDVLLHALPIFHVHGLFIASHCALLNGTPMVWLPKFDASVVAQQLHAATVLMGVPTFYVRLLALPEFAQQSVAHVRVFICGSAPLTEQVFTEWADTTGARILERYGMSETIINTSNPLDGQRVPATVGFPLPGLQLRIADDQGKEVATGEVGTIEVRGPNVFGGYWRMPEKTAEEIRSDGFFITGDLGTVDAEGRVSIVGRAKDLVISGGYNVYPKEVERLIDEIPGIVESAVIGVPHRDFGEGVVAVIVPEDQDVETDIVTTALEGRLARFKQPKRVLNVAELPRNTMGKVQKNLLREQYQGLFED